MIIHYILYRHTQIEHNKSVLMGCKWLTYLLQEPTNGRKWNVVNYAKQTQSHAH
jgi:hypothetical protein